MSSTTGVISGSIKWTGLASGTDFGAVVEKLVAIENRTINRQESWKKEWQDKIVAISGLNTRLVSLKLDAQSKDIRSEMLSRKSSISNDKVFSVVNTSTASLGSYDVVVAEKVPEKLASKSFLGAVGGTSLDSIADTSGSKIQIQVGEDQVPPVILELEADDSVTVGSGTAGYFNPGDTLEDLAKAINATVAKYAVDNPDHPINLKASIMADKTRGTDNYQRLVLTATDGGNANHIKIIKDETDLGLGQNFIDEPVYSAFLGSTAKVNIPQDDNVSDPPVPGSHYIGTVNKTFTFLAQNNGILGVDDIVMQWADTEGHTGKFTVTAADFNSTPDKRYEIFQGLEISFESVGSDGGRFIQNEAFTIDCQAPVLQKGQDNGLAQTAKVVHEGFVDQISPITVGSSGQFVYRYQGVEHTINVSDRASLSILATSINEDKGNPGVTATIVNDGLGTSTSYHLVLTGNHTGAESTIEIVNPETGHGLNLLGGDNIADKFSTAREASNAMLKVDGFPATSDQWLQRRSNDVSDVIDGVVMTLTGVGSSTLTVSNDSTAMRDKIVQLVESVNFCKSYISEFTKWGESNLVTSMAESGEVLTSRENPNGIMIGNYGFQISKTNLDSLMNRNIVPFSENPALDVKAKLEKRQKYLDDNGLVYSTLSEIGITSDPDNKGLYKVEQAKLLQCINENPEAVIKLFTFTDEYTDIGRDGKEKPVKINGFSIELGETMAKLTSSDDIYDTEGNVIQKGKGIMVTLQENYEGIISNINAKIAREERRIDAVRQRLTDKFNRLETALQAMESQQSKLDASISSLNSNSGS